MQFPVLPRTASDLDALASARAGANNRESIPVPIYSVKTFTSATTTQLTFFTDADQAAGALTNMRQQGMIPKGDFFALYFLTLDILGLVPGDTDNAADMYYVRNGFTLADGIPYATLTYGSKPYPPAGGWPLAAIGPSGPLNTFGAGTLTTAYEVAEGGAPPLFMGEDADGMPSLLFTGGTPFSWTLKWPSVVTLTTSPLMLMLTMWGTYYRGIQ